MIVKLLHEQNMLISNSLLTQNKLGLSNSTVDMSNTIADNENGINSSNDNIFIANTIIANNDGYDFNGLGNSRGTNCISDNSGSSIFTLSTDMNSTDPMLNNLSDNGGYVQTMSLKYDIPCLNTGNLIYAITNYDEMDTIE
jgi:hypothetical protein